MDMHRQKFKPSYIAARQARAARGHGHAGMKPNNPHGRPPKLTGLEDRDMFKIKPKTGWSELKGRYEFNRFMRQVIQREFNMAVLVAGGQMVAEGRLCKRDFARIYGPTLEITTKVGQAFILIMVEKHRLMVRVRIEVRDEDRIPTTFKVKSIKPVETTMAINHPALVKYPAFWPVEPVFDGGSAIEWDGDCSRMVEPDAVWSDDKVGNAAFLYGQFVKFLAWLVPDKAEAINNLPPRPWKF